MKATGIVRKVDELGRIVLPIELRRVLDIDVRDALEIYVHQGKIVLTKYEPTCVFCGEAKNIRHISHKNVCLSCMGKISDEYRVTDTTPTETPAEQ